MRGGYGPWEFFMIFALLLLARESPKWKGEIGRRERIRVAIDGRMEGGLCWFIYFPVFTVC